MHPEKTYKPQIKIIKVNLMKNKLSKYDLQCLLLYKRLLPVIHYN